ncbi:MAG: Asp-tRNA(Asn)/Glu-tRNA(Gln) amidotransferase GatCAB subunit B, partial [Planctomycetota bacterium]|nr:Asp-tRNA(Asn)/Glu-tRNA(Gln) amidotransferase GatCAB subunit B [Planctomycetota bacterium]
TTFLMREKEEAHDYRYFPEPDIPPIHIDTAWRAEAALLVPELPAAKRRRFASEFGLNDYDADTLCRERKTAEFFEAVVGAGAAAKPAVNWILTDLNRHANERKSGVADLGLAPERLAAMIGLVEGGTVARKAASKQILPRLLADATADPTRLVEELGLAQIEDDTLIREASKRALEANPRAAADYKGGKEKALGALMGFVMRELKGKANSATVRSVLLEVLGSS